MSIQWIIIGVSAVLIVFIIFRKFPTLASVDTKALPEEKHTVLKKNLYTERLQRKIKERTRTVKLLIVPFWGVLQNLALTGYKKLRELGKQYHLKSRQGHLPDSPNVAERDVLVRAEELFYTGKLKQAEEEYISVIEHNPKNVDAYEGLAEVYLALKDYEHSEEVLQYIVKLKEQMLPEGDSRNSKATMPGKEKSDLASHHFDLGEVHFQNGERAQALRSYKDAVRLDPKNPKYLHRLLETALEQKNVLLAKKTFNTIKSVNPNNSKISEWNNRLESL